jgi:maltooligosyltrehalose synthase
MEGNRSRVVNDPNCVVKEIVKMDNEIQRILERQVQNKQIKSELDALLPVAKTIEQEVIKIKEENKKLKETNFKLLGRLSTYAGYVEKFEKQVESLQKDVARKLETNSRLREENREIKIEIEVLFDNWALGNYTEALFFANLQMLIHKLQQS